MARTLFCAVLMSSALAVGFPAHAQFGFSPAASVSARSVDVVTGAIGTSVQMIRGAEVVVDRTLALKVTGIALSADAARLVLAEAGGAVSVVDLNQGHEVARLAPGQPGTGDVAALAATARGGARTAVANHLTLAVADGVAVVKDAAGTVVARVILARQGWAAVAQSGLFEAEGDGMEAAKWTADDNSFALEQFSDSHYEPGLLARLLAAAPAPHVVAAAPAVAPKAEEALAPPPAPKVELSKEFAMPPSAAFDGVKDGTASDAEAFSLPFAVKNQGGGVEEIRLYQNGKLVWSDSPRSDQDVRGTVPAKLAQGSNEFRLVALSRDRIESRPAKVKVDYTGAERKSVLHVVAIGISAYKNPALNLNYGVSDAEGIVGYFSKQPKTLYRDVVVHKLYDTQATKSAILDVLDSLKATNPEDAVLIYLAGHGDTMGESWYFMPHEVRYPEREDEVKAYGLSSAELNERIKGMGAQKVLMLVDACKSGAALVAFRGFEDRKALMRVARASGVHVVAAAGKEQFAAELVQLGHGLFTYTLLQGLAGKADTKQAHTVTVRNLTNYIEDQLPEISQNYKGVAQFPVVDSRGMDFPVAVY